MSASEPLLLDGALGTELTRWGIDTSAPLWSARALVDDVDAIVEIHQDYVRAGCDVLTACTFRTQERTLLRAGLGGRGRDLNRTAIDAARQAIALEGRTGVRVAGSVAPLEDCFRPDLVPERTTLAAEHAAHARSLREAGADLLLCETMGSRREATAAVMAAVATGLPTWCSFLTSAPGRLLSGEPLGEAVQAVEDIGAAMVLVNCVPAGEVLADLEALLDVAHVPAGCFPTVGHGRAVEGWREDLALPPSQFAELLVACRDLGAEIVGGCCGTQPEHLAAAARLLRGQVVVDGT